ncbi:MAG: hypothetical protein HN712_17450 [Gemmatimonadetes bacterium]|nr:hypothetical protein [Gemmatimonadota bacterium]MBT6147963.1 hypothetical protein [Gemmatimonadota bacterium]MBT7862106.1 hypothetical protein [Gemmatimonadota bacterium]
MRGNGLWCLLLVLLAQSCAPPPAPIRRSGWEPTADVAQIVRQLSLSTPDIQDLTAPAQITLTHEDRPQSASASFQYLPPQLMRIDVRGPLFQHVLTAVLDGDTLWALADGHLSRYGARQGLVDLLNIDLGDQDPITTLLGLIGPITATDSIRVDYPRADRAVAVVSSTDGSERRLWVDLLSGFIVQEEGLDAHGRRRWRRHLTDYARLGEGDTYLPRRVRIESGPQSLEMRFGEWRLDRQLSPSDFYKGLQR